MGFVVKIGAISLLLWALCALAGDNAWWVMGPTLGVLALGAAKAWRDLQKTRADALRQVAEARKWYEENVR